MTNKERILEHNERIENLIDIIEQKQFGTIALPPLAYPASPEDVLEGKEAIDEDGNVIVGTLVPATGGDTTSEDGIISRTITSYVNPRVSVVGSCAFMYCAQLTSVDLANCTELKPSAFAFCSNLTTANAPNVKVFGQSAFGSCTSLRSINAPKCSTVMNNAFANCAALSIFSAPDLTGLSAGAFQSCKALTEADFSKCTTMASSVFSGCTALTRANFPLLRQVGSQAFRGCTSLTDTSFDACTTVGVGAFSSCTAIETLDFPVASMISASAFTGCSKLTMLILRSTACVKLSNVNAFATTPMSKSTYTGAFGSIYVLPELVEEYKAATNWVTYSDRITAIVE